MFAPAAGLYFWNPKHWKYFTRAMKGFAEAAAYDVSGGKVGKRDYVQKVIDEAHIWFPDAKDPFGDQLARANVAAVMDTIGQSAVKKGTDIGDLIADLTFGSVMAKSIPLGKKATGNRFVETPRVEVPGWVASGLWGALIGGTTADDDESAIGRALKGFAYGAAANPLARGMRWKYGHGDPFFKAAAYEMMKDKGMSLPEIRKSLRENFQNYEEQPKAIRMLAGREPGFVGTMAKVFGNPFFAFHAETVRVLKNVWKRDPMKAMMISNTIPIIQAAGLLGTGAAAYFTGNAFGKRDETIEGPLGMPNLLPPKEERRAFRNRFPGHVMIPEAEGKYGALSFVYTWPGAEDAMDVMRLVGASDFKKTGMEILHNYALSSPFWSVPLNSYLLAQDPEARDPRTGFKMRRPGESSGGAIGRMALGTASWPLAPYSGQHFERLKDAGVIPGEEGLPFRRGMSEKPPDKIRALAAVAGQLTKEVDWPQEYDKIDAEYDRRFKALKTQMERDLRDPNVEVNPMKTLALEERYEKEFDALEQEFEGQKGKFSKELPFK